MMVSQVLANQAAAAKAKAMAAKASIEQKKRLMEEQKKKAIATAKRMKDAKLKVARQKMAEIKKTINDLESNVDIDVSGIADMMSYGVPADKRIRNIIRSGRRRPKKAEHHNLYLNRDGYFDYRDRRLLQPKYSVGDTIHWNTKEDHDQYDGWRAKVIWRRGTPGGRRGRKVLGKKFYYEDNNMFFGAKRSRKTLGPTLKQLQTLARRNKVSIYKMRKDRRGYTKMPLTKKALKARLSRARVSYKNLKAPRPRTRIRPRKSYVSSSPVLDPRRGCPAGKYKDPATGICKTIPKYEDLDELDSVNFDWSSDRTFSNRPLSTQMYGRSCFGDIPPCDCGL